MLQQYSTKHSNNIAATSQCFCNIMSKMLQRCYIIAGMFCAGIFCVGMFCAGMLCAGMFCAGMFCAGMFCIEYFIDRCCVKIKLQQELIN